MKDRLIGGAIGTASGIIVGVVLFFFGGIRSEAKAFEDLVNSKVDKTEFREYKSENEKAHSEIEESIDEEITELKQEFGEKIKEQGDDLKYIRKRLDEYLDSRAKAR